MNFENILELIIDDEELLMIPPFIGGSSSVLNTRNKGAILQMKMFSQMNIRRLLEGEESAPHHHQLTRKSDEHHQDSQSGYLKTQVKVRSKLQR